MAPPLQINLLVGSRALTEGPDVPPPQAGARPLHLPKNGGDIHLHAGAMVVPGARRAPNVEINALNRTFPESLKVVYKVVFRVI